MPATAAAASANLPRLMSARPFPIFEPFSTRAFVSASESAVSKCATAGLEHRVRRERLAVRRRRSVFAGERNARAPTLAEHHLGVREEHVQLAAIGQRRRRCRGENSRRALSGRTGPLHCAVYGLHLAVRLDRLSRVDRQASVERVARQQLVGEVAGDRDEGIRAAIERRREVGDDANAERRRAGGRRVVTGIQNVWIGHLEERVLLAPRRRRSQRERRPGDDSGAGLRRERHHSPDIVSVGHGCSRLRSQG